MEKFTKQFLFERLKDAEKINEAEFEEDYRYAVGELLAMYGQKYVLEDESAEVREEYMPAIASAILFYIRSDVAERRYFEERSKAAFRTVWKEKAIKAREQREAST